MNPSIFLRSKEKQTPKMEVINIYSWFCTSSSLESQLKKKTGTTINTFFFLLQIHEKHVASHLEIYSTFTKMKYFPANRDLIKLPQNDT